MNDYYRKILDTQIKKGLADARLAIELKHPFLTGKLREIVLHQLIEPMLNDNYSIGNGKVVDYEGNMSKEMDLCIYSKNLHPPIFFSSNEKLGIFPIESLLNAIEVKSELNMKNLKDTFSKFTQLNEDLIMTAAFHDENHDAIETYFVKPHYSLFAFNTHLKKYSPEKILELYSKVDKEWDTFPLVTNICIANKGWLCNTHQGWIHISYNSMNNFNEEIVGFLATLVNDLPRIEESRGTPRIGYYLTDPFNVDKLIEDKFINKPWGEGKYVFRNSNP
jgi:hypothetical protein